MEFGQKKSREIDLFDFTSFFGLDFFKFFGPLCIREKGGERIIPRIFLHRVEKSIELALTNST